MDNDLRVAVLMGGLSSEREVSLRSGKAVKAALERLGYHTIPVDVQEDVAEVLRREKPDVAFNTLHGKYGEDGTIQGVLEFLRIPYTGSGVAASALAMDKLISKRLLMQEGIPVAPYQVVRFSDLDEASLGKPSFDFPVVVKPRAEGSSVGISLVKSIETLGPALESAFGYDDTVLIEKFIPGREIHIGVLEQQVLGAIEVKSSNDIYDYEAKYTAGKTQYILEPDLDKQALEQMAMYALRALDAFGCEGATRVDFILGDDGVPYMLELNTLPGMTELSLLPKIAAQSGRSFEEFVESILLGARLKL